MNIKRVISAWAKLNSDFIKNKLLSIKRKETLANEAGDLYKQVHENSQPYFVLSTGRAGTLFLTKALSFYSAFDVQHSPYPELVYHSKLAFQNPREESLTMAIDIARYELIRDSYLNKQTYVETNNKITFFAQQLSVLYPKSKFLHLKRKPIPFIKSGMARPWYENKDVYDEGRIIPKLSIEEWNRLKKYEKIALLWKETNQFIEQFKLQLPKDRHLTVWSEDLYANANILSETLRFFGVADHSQKKVAKLLKKPTNKTPSSKIQEFSQEEIQKIALLLQPYYNLE